MSQTYDIRTKTKNIFLVIIKKNNTKSQKTLPSSTKRYKIMLLEVRAYN